MLERRQCRLDRPALGGGELSSAWSTDGVRWSRICSRQLAAGIGDLDPGGAAVGRIGGTRDQARVGQARDRARQQRRVEALALGDLGQTDRAVAVRSSSRTITRVGVSSAARPASVGRSARASRPRRSGLAVQSPCPSLSPSCAFPSYLLAGKHLSSVGSGRPYRSQSRHLLRRVTLLGSIRLPATSLGVDCAERPNGRERSAHRLCSSPLR